MQREHTCPPHVSRGQHTHQHTHTRTHTRTHTQVWSRTTFPYRWCWCDAVFCLVRPIDTMSFHMDKNVLRVNDGLDNSLVCCNVTHTSPNPNPNRPRPSCTHSAQTTGGNSLPPIYAQDTECERSRVSVLLSRAPQTTDKH